MGARPPNDQAPTFMLKRQVSRQENVCRADHELEVQDDLEILNLPSPASATPFHTPSERGPRNPGVPSKNEPRQRNLDRQSNEQ